MINHMSIVMLIYILLTSRTSDFILIVVINNIHNYIYIIK